MGWGIRLKFKDFINWGWFVFIFGFVDDNDDDVVVSVVVVGIGVIFEVIGFFLEVVVIFESEEKKMGNLFGNGNLVGWIFEGKLE